MAHVILGLLLFGPHSFYDLIKSFEAGVSLFYSASSGSIRRALDQLLTRGLVEVATVEPGGRRRKVYRITERGTVEFHTWMTSGSLTDPDPETAALSRLYFLGLATAPERAPLLRRIIVRIEADLAELLAVADQVDAMQVPDELRDISFHQRATLDYGISSHRAALEWLRGHLDRTEGSAEGSR